MKIIQTNFQYRKTLIQLNLEKVLYIVIHHPDWILASPEDIHNDVMADPKKSDWAGFPYNEYIRKDGTVYIGRGDNIGAQCENMNSKSYGISCEGNYDIEKAMPEAQFNSLVERIKFNKPRFKNLIEVAPHSKLNNTSCPGKYFPMQQILEAVNKDNRPKLKVNGQPVNADIKIENGVMYGPLRVIFEAQGNIVNWDPKTNTADIVKKG